MPEPDNDGQLAAFMVATHSRSNSDLAVELDDGWPKIHFPTEEGALPEIEDPLDESKLDSLEEVFNKIYARNLKDCVDRGLFSKEDLDAAGYPEVSQELYDYISKTPERLKDPKFIAERNKRMSEMRERIEARLQHRKLGA